MVYKEAIQEITMAKENKQLLLTDLCARLPYGVCVHIRYKEGEPCYGKLTPRDIQWFIDSNIENIKPYLRPMSSMTEEEIEILEDIRDYAHTNEDYATKLIDFYNSHHLDYRGLIPEGLALEAPEGMYDLKKK